MKTENTPQAGSYESSLTEDERSTLHLLLLSNASLHELREQTIPWREGPDQGMKPSVATLWKIQTRLRTENMMLGLQGMLDTIHSTKAQLATLTSDTDQEQMLDAAMAAIAREAFDGAMQGANPAAQKIITRLLLKRADQRRFDRRMDFLETGLAKTQKIPPAPARKQGKTPMTAPE